VLRRDADELRAARAKENEMRAALQAATSMLAESSPNFPLRTTSSQTPARTPATPGRPATVDAADSRFVVRKQVLTLYVDLSREASLPKLNSLARQFSVCTAVQGDVTTKEEGCQLRDGSVPPCRAVLAYDTNQDGLVDARAAAPAAWAGGRGSAEERLKNGGGAVLRHELERLEEANHHLQVCSRARRRAGWLSSKVFLPFSSTTDPEAS
jgi:hypothetical protein